MVLHEEVERVTQANTASHTGMLAITGGGGGQCKLEGYVKYSKFVIEGSVHCLCLRSCTISVDCVPFRN
jgi:hypothetical protein